MAKRFTVEEDRMIHDFDYLCAADLGRSEESVQARIRKLKATGAWKVFDMIEYLEVTSRRLLDRPLEMDVGLTNEERRTLALELVDEIYPIMKRHSVKSAQSEYDKCFPEEE